jgi:hypothetical protein
VQSINHWASFPHFPQLHCISFKPGH